MQINELSGPHLDLRLHMCIFLQSVHLFGRYAFSIRSESRERIYIYDYRLCLIPPNASSLLLDPTKEDSPRK